MEINFKIINKTNNKIINDKICRICMKSDKLLFKNNFSLDSTLIYTSKNHSYNEILIKDIYQQVSSIDVNIFNDTLPNSICHICIAKLINCHELRLQCINSDVELRNIYVDKKSSSFNLNASIDSDYERQVCENSFNIDKNISNIEDEISDQFNSFVEIKPENNVLNEDTKDNEKYIKTDKNSKNTICNVCGKAMKSKEVLKKHLIRHGDKKIDCSHCDKHFYSKYELKRHLISHKNINRCICEECGATFSRKDKLLIHKNIHLGIKPHICTYCDKRFLKLSTLKNHIITHLKIKPYKCKFCEKSYTQRNPLLQHIKKNHKDQNHFEIEPVSLAI